MYRHTDLVAGQPENKFISPSQNAVNAVFGKVPGSLNLNDIVGK